MVLMFGTVVFAAAAWFYVQRRRARKNASA